MILGFLREVATEFRNEPAIIWRDKPFSYEWLFDRVDYWTEFIEEREIHPGLVVAIEGDFSPNSVAVFLALVERACVVVPLTRSVAAKRDEFLRVGDIQVSIALDDSDEGSVTWLDGEGTHEVFDTLRERDHPGLILYSSGSTGESKAAVHDLVPLLRKFETRKRRLRMIAFLLFDHIGGLNTLLYALSNGGSIVIVADRTPETVLATIERHKVEALPTSPTFINLILLSGAHADYDLSSLKVVTYGTEPMAESTLRRFHALYPDLRLQQTYGLTELGILRSQSKDSNSLWVKIGGEGFQTRVVDGILHIKAESTMLGYMNAPSPFTEDGWFDTGDSVTVDGEYMRIHGRRSESINVGGEKVHPTEVESVIQEVDGVEEATVFGERNAILGNIVCATIRPRDGVDVSALVAEIKKHCGEELQRYKVPMKITTETDVQYTSRFKKKRPGAAAL